MLAERGSIKNTRERVDPSHLVTTNAQIGQVVQIDANGMASWGPFGDNPTGGKDYFVNTAVTASGDGRNWATAFKTMAEAVAVLAAGDTIWLQGSITAEAVSITGLSGITIIGAGPSSNRALWTAPDTTAPCLTLNASPDCAILNIRFRPPVANAGISLVGASHQARIQGCRFQGKSGSYDGILSDGAQANVQILDNQFYYLNTASTNGHAIRGMTYAAEPAGWEIERNKFVSNNHHIVCRLNRSLLRDNVFTGLGLSATNTEVAPTKCIDISGGTAAAPGCNTVTRNTLGGAYTSTLYVPGANDIWYENYCAVTSTTAPDGRSILPPA